MNIRLLFNSKTAVTALAVTMALAGCSGTNKAADTTSADNPTHEQKGKGGGGGGPQLGKPGGGPSIDKSGDAYLQAMIKEVVPEFKQFEYKYKATGKSIKYNLFIPDTARVSEKVPLVLFMADASTPGDNVTAPLTQGYGAQF